MHWKQPTRKKKISIFGDPSLLTGAIAKMEDTTIHLDKSRWKNRAQGLKNRNFPLTTKLFVQQPNDAF